MRLEPLYRVRFTYPRGWQVATTGSLGTEEQHFYLAEGRCEGRISGRFQGANHPRRRTDQTFVPDFQGIIETDDGAVIFFDYRGHGRGACSPRRGLARPRLGRLRIGLGNDERVTRDVEAPQEDPLRA